MITPHEVTQCLHLAKALDLISSSRMVGGILYVYTVAGQLKPLDHFTAEFPLERLQAMARKRL
ncbi:hypothetical protein [Leptolyngbya sp. FACHB-711]|jgi:hypothetical protein|uniref:hypothetical protein n=1 Tax=unclassified Leptolyngbya TaxID=2650499 RepID=UPI001683B770|nr:hypothetical protein [Leptolyngbya sp. FACHB-711]MBD1850541.1 hypothetical protein [Cyanobacteria bacterium FACHB-502]MBD2026757.1 hypothetical protein [Leptolyngbya sp. FACHB-711]